MKPRHLNRSLTFGLGKNIESLFHNGVLNFSPEGNLRLKPDISQQILAYFPLSPAKKKKKKITQNGFEPDYKENNLDTHSIWKTE